MSKRNRERRQQQPAPAYQQAVIAAARQLQAEGALYPGRVYALAIYHDGDCALFAGRGPCDCQPVVGTPQLVPVPEDN
jgi:hypothetical protein